MPNKNILTKFLLWRIKNISNTNFIFILSIIIGVLGGIVAAILKNLVHFIRTLLTSGFSTEYGNYMYFIYPIIGITLTVLFIRYIIRKWEGHGIPEVLYSISRKNGKMAPHHVYSSIITSSLTVGFGGSVGLEGHIIATGAGIGSNLGRILHLKQKETILLIGVASAASLSAIFKAPITGIVYVLEILMLNLNLTSLMALLLASTSAVLTSYVLLGKDVIYPVNLQFEFSNDLLPFFILFALLSGLVSLYYYNTHVFINKLFEKLKTWYFKLLVGTTILGAIIMIFPSLYGEGYESINSSLNGSYMHLFKKTFFFSQNDNLNFVLVIILLVILLKVIVATITIASGGVGGVFAPTLFIGANLGLGFALFSNYYFGTNLDPVVFSLAGMAGMISGVLHGPLTSIFIIVELTSSYNMFVPLMIVSSISFFTVRIFNKYSIYTYQLAKRGDLVTHDKDKSALQMLEISKLLETNFRTVKKNYALREVIKEIEQSSRNIFPVVDDNGNLEGLLLLDDIRKFIFKPEYYDKIQVKDVIYKLKSHEIVNIDKDNMEAVVNKFNITGHYNLPVVKDGKYLGFLSRATVFTSYRKLINLFSGE